MIGFNSNSDLLRVITSAAGGIDVRVDGQDLNTATNPPTWSIYKQPTQIATATTTTIATGSATATVSRNIRLVMARNTATTSNTLTFETFDNASGLTTTCYQVTLAPGDAVHYVEGFGWEYLPATPTVQVPGRLLKTTTVTSGTTFTTGASTNTMRVRLMGGGGGGAGCTAVASAASAGGGGGGGGYAEKLFPAAPSTAYTIAIGGGGAGNSGAAGSNGGATTFTANGVTVTANGGTGAVVATAVTTLSAYAGGAGAAVSTNGDFNGVGAPGEPGVTLVVATPIVASGSGGSSLWGDGGIGLTAVGNGNNGAGFGGGGGGGATGASTVRTGGSGSGGAIIVDEFS